MNKVVTAGSESKNGKRSMLFTNKLVDRYVIRKEVGKQDNKLKPHFYHCNKDVYAGNHTKIKTFETMGGVYLKF